MRFTRRQIAVGFGVAAVPGLAFPPSGAAAESLPVNSLMAPGPLVDIVIGAEKAPVTVIEYAALTSADCKHFRSEVYPALAAKYIEPGKVRFIVREYVVDPLDTAGWMITRSLGDDKRTALVDLLLDKQETWIHDAPVNHLFAVAGEAGCTQETFDGCLKDRQLYDAVVQTAKFAEEQLGVNSAPTFFINGAKFSGAERLEDFDKIILPMLRT